jgi:hypothetical protein
MGGVEDAWAGYIWPGIRRKVAATLQAASREVTPRACSFEFLGTARLLHFQDLVVRAKVVTLATCVISALMVASQSEDGLVLRTMYCSIWLN